MTRSGKYDHIKTILIFSLRLVQLSLFGVGTALVYLSNIRLKKGKSFKPFNPFTPMTVTRFVTPSPPALIPSTSRAMTVPVYKGYLDNKEEDTEVNKPEPEVVKPKVVLDPTFPGAMKGLGFSKAELKLIIHEITAPDLPGQIRQALKLLGKPTVTVLQTYTS